MASEEPRTQQRQQTITRRHAIAKQAWHEQDGGVQTPAPRARARTFLCGPALVMLSVPGLMAP